MDTDVKGISTSQIDSMLAMLRNTAAQAAPSSAHRTDLNPGMPIGGEATESVSKVSFADSLKLSLDQLNKGQLEAQQMGEKFAAGDSKTSISDVLLALRKADISLQLSVQTRNKLVASYNEIMNMQV